MFTGLIQDVGQISAMTPQADGARLRIKTQLAADLALGDSLAVNGVCLTVTENQGDEVSVMAVAETLRRTTVGQLKRGGAVNLEPALRASDRLGGHIVQGHVDGTTRVVRVDKRGQGNEVHFELPGSHAKYVVHKGSVALDGVSLTVADVRVETFMVALVPHTLAQTTFGDLRVGVAVNIEVDVIAKYAERLLLPYQGGVSMQMLKDNGYSS